MFRNVKSLAYAAAAALALASTTSTLNGVMADGPVADTTPGTAVISAEAESAWWNTLSAEQQAELASMFDPEWFNVQSMETKIAYCYVTQTIYDWLNTPGVDSRDDDSYTSFAPLLLRASFHAAGTFHAPTGTGGTASGSIFSAGEQEDGGNACISPAVQEMEELFRGSPRVPLPDAMVIGGSVALDMMDFPRMDLLPIYGGRSQVGGLAWRDRLPNPDFNPTELFREAYNLTDSEFTALIGGGHNFGSAHGVCSGYVGDWTKNPLSWTSVEDPNGSEFFVDLLKEDWRWYEVCTYQNGTSVFTTIDDPFAPGAVEEEEEEEEEELDACSVHLSDVPFICEAQAMRGCDFPDGAYAPNHPDIIGCQFRLKSDFFLKADPALLPLSIGFAEDDNLLAETFGNAYHKLTHAGLFRCGISGFGCGDGAVCKDVFDTESGDYLTSYCEASSAMEGGPDSGTPTPYSVESSENDSFSLSSGGSIALICVCAILALWAVSMCFILGQTNKKLELANRAAAKAQAQVAAATSYEGKDQPPTSDSSQENTDHDETEVFDDQHVYNA